MTDDKNMPETIYVGEIIPPTIEYVVKDIFWFCKQTGKIFEEDIGGCIKYVRADLVQPAFDVALVRYALHDARGIARQYDTSLQRGRVEADFGTIRNVLTEALAELDKAGLPTMSDYPYDTSDYIELPPRAGLPYIEGLADAVQRAGGWDCWSRLTPDDVDALSMAAHEYLKRMAAAPKAGE